MTIGVVTGMLAEARLLDGLDCRVVVAGGNPGATLAKTEELVRGGVTALASFGIAGALDARLKPGDLVLATSVVLPDGRRIDCDDAWRKRAQGRIASTDLRANKGGENAAGISGIIAGRSIVIATRAAKNDLFRATGALTVDMESHHVAVVASRCNLPFLILRAVADTAADDLPAAACAGLTAEGRPAIGAVLRSLLANPRQLPALIRVALCSHTALNALLSGRAGLF